MVSAIVVFPVRGKSSEIWIGNVFPPSDVPSATVALNEKELSLAVTSPFVALSKKDCVADPPIDERSPTTVMPVLCGFAPGVTATVNRVVPPTTKLFGLAAPTPDGLVGVRTVREIEVLPVRDRGLVSVIVTGRVLAPPLVPFATVALKLKMLSPAVTSPLVVPSSEKL